jgi:hypothetical protein
MLGTIMRLRGGKKRPAVTSDVEGCIFSSDVVAMCVLRACVCVCVCVCVLGNKQCYTPCFSAFIQSRNKLLTNENSSTDAGQRLPALEHVMLGLDHL